MLFKKILSLKNKSGYWSATDWSSSGKKVGERKGTRKERLTTSTPPARV